MEPLLLLCLFPLAWPFIAKRIWHEQINYQEMALSIVIVTLVTVGVWQLGKWSATSDTEIWNGQVTKKEMNDGYYQTSYSCNCTTDSKGNQSCQTCYEDHYTRSYDGYSTVGSWTFDSIDTTSRWRRDAFKAPASYNNCKIGEPASREHSYTNYVQAVPESLFHDNSTVAEQFAEQIPAYPRVHSFYKINRILQVGVNYQHADDLNTMFNEALKQLGAQKQVNIIVILTNITDPTYRYAIENAWLGGEKNDVIVIVGLDGDKIIWSDTITWALNSGNELFNVTMRDSVTKLGTLDPTTFVPFVVFTINQLYDRPEMKDYEYLEDEISPPTWAIVLAIILSIGGSLGATFFFHQKDVDFLGHRRYNRRNFFNKRR